MRIAFYTLGCKVNQYESQAMSAASSAAGFEVVDSCEPADVYVVNSCTVTAESDRKARQAVRRFKHRGGEPTVVLTGCVTQAFPQAARELREADIVLGHADSAALVEAINEFFERGERIVRISPHETGERFSGGCISDFRDRTRAVVKIEDGCNRFCSYCMIPFARGRVRSKPLDALEKELAALDAAGFGEVVLVGINLSAFGTDCGLSLADATRLACSFSSIRRVRLGSLEPDHLTPALVGELQKHEKLCPQFHISLQSGCENTLRRMNRHYSPDDYLRLCESLRRSFCDTSLTTDVMVGFPGESEADFLESLGFVKKIAFEKVHVFPYSVRPGTAAASLGGQLSRAEKEKRARLMSEAAQEIREAFLLSQKGKTVEVLVEEHTKAGRAKGFTANYTPVEITNKKAHAGFVNVLITGAENDCCVGEVV